MLSTTAQIRLERQESEHQPTNVVSGAEKLRKRLAAGGDFGCMRVVAYLGEVRRCLLSNSVRWILGHRVDANNKRSVRIYALDYNIDTRQKYVTILRFGGTGAHILILQAIQIARSSRNVYPPPSFIDSLISV